MNLKTMMCLSLLIFIVKDTRCLLKLCKNVYVDQIGCVFCRAKSKPTEDITGNFLEFFLKWKYPLKANQNVGTCFTLNFGTKQKIDDLPMLTMSLKNSIRYDNAITTPTDNCFLVLVGGKYVKIIEEVVKKVEKIIKNIGISPLAMLIQSKSNKISTGTFLNYPMVSIVCIFNLNNFHHSFNKTLRSSIISKFFSIQKEIVELDSGCSVQEFTREFPTK